MPAKKRRSTVQAKKDLPLPADHEVKGGDTRQALLATTLSNLAAMRHEMLKSVANNLRG